RSELSYIGHPPIWSAPFPRGRIGTHPALPPSKADASRRAVEQVLLPCTCSTARLPYPLRPVPKGPNSDLATPRAYPQRVKSPSPPARPRARDRRDRG